MCTTCNCIKCVHLLFTTSQKRAHMILERDVGEMTYYGGVAINRSKVRCSKCKVKAAGANKCDALVRRYANQGCTLSPLQGCREEGNLESEAGKNKNNYVSDIYQKFCFISLYVAKNQCSHNMEIITMYTMQIHFMHYIAMCPFCKIPNKAHQDTDEHIITISLFLAYSI